MSIELDHSVAEERYPNEAAVLRELLDRLSSHSVYHIRIITAGRTGVPDVVACYMGRFIAIECKGLEGRISQLQIMNLDRCQRSGGKTLIVTPYNVESIMQELEDLV